MGLTRAILEAQEYASRVGREDYADYLKGFGKRVSRMIKEGMDKPRIRKSDATMWVCVCDDTIAFGKTSEEAYKVWKSISTNRHNAVAY